MPGLKRRRGLKYYRGATYEGTPPSLYRTFDGVNDSLQSASTIDLSGVNKITVAFWLWWDSFANDDDLALEFTSNYNNFTTGFLVGPNESSQTRFQIAVKGDVGYNNANYTRPSGAAWHHYVVIFDKSQALNEVDMYLDGVLQTPFSRANSSNNTNNFGNDTLNVMCRNNASLFGDGRMARLALWPGERLAQAEVSDLYRGRLATEVRPGSSPYYWPIKGTASPEPAADKRNINLTVFT